MCFFQISNNHLPTTNGRQAWLSHLEPTAYKLCWISSTRWKHYRRPTECGVYRRVRADWLAWSWNTLRRAPFGVIRQRPRSWLFWHPIRVGPPSAHIPSQVRIFIYYIFLNNNYIKPLLPFSYHLVIYLIYLFISSQIDRKTLWLMECQCLCHHR